MQTKTLLAASFAAAAALGLGASSARAGFVATSGPDAVTLTDSMPSLGDAFTISAGTFSTFVPNTPQDPQITTDLDRYGYAFDSTATSVNPTTTAVGYTGNYRIFYNVDGNDTYDPSAGDLSVSFGTLNASILPVTSAGGNTLTVTFGALMQTQGPENPAFADLSYGGNDVGVNGTLIVPTSGSPVTGTAALTFTQLAPIPEPTTAGLIGVAAAGLLARRRRAAF